MPITAISSVWYPIENWECAKQFYSDILGLTLNACNDETGWAAYQTSAGGTPFFLVRKPNLAPRSNGAVVTFDVTDCQSLLQKIADFGARIDPHVQESGEVRIYTIYDPDGNVLELSETRSHP